MMMKILLERLLYKTNFSKMMTVNMRLCQFSACVVNDLWSGHIVQ